MSNVCQIYTTITLDTLDNMVYTLDIHGANIEHIIHGGNHGKSIHGENESWADWKSCGLFCNDM
jgi:hypothetical protein